MVYSYNAGDRPMEQGFFPDLFYCHNDVQPEQHHRSISLLFFSPGGSNIFHMGIGIIVTLTAGSDADGLSAALQWR